MNNYDLYHSSWTPPYCPSPKCKHHGGLREGWKFKRMGSFFRKAEPHRIRRFQCLVCGVTFSSQTFSATYWLKRPDILPKLMTKTVGCMCNRQLNLLDLLVRHGSGNHKRETIAYSKRRQCAAMRLAIFLVWRNYVRLRRVRRCSESPAMLLGLCSSRLTVDEVLSRRLFVYLVDLQGRWREYYWSAVETRGLKVNRRHDLKRAV